MLAGTIEKRLRAAGRTDSCLLPSKFKEFLKDVYFARFDAETGGPLSRNTVAHGVVTHTDHSTSRAH